MWPRNIKIFNHRRMLKEAAKNIWPDCLLEGGLGDRPVRPDFFQHRCRVDLLYARVGASGVAVQIGDEFIGRYPSRSRSRYRWRQ